MGDLPILRYAAPIGKTRDQMRSWLRNTDEGRALYNHGDCRLVWVNEGDLDRVQFLTDIAATRETDLRAEVERCHARLEIDHAFTAGPDDQLVRYEIPMAERASMPDGIECRDDTIKLQDEQIDRLRGLLDEARRLIIASLGHNRDNGDFAGREALLAWGQDTLAKIGGQHD